MKIIFLGLIGFGTTALEALIKENHNIKLVITEKYTDNQILNKKLNFTLPLQYYSLKEYIKHNNIVPLCKKNNIPYIETDNNFNFNKIEEKIKKIMPDLIIVSTFNKIIPESIIKLAKFAFNVHPGILPQYRGPSPIEWSILNEEKETGLTFHILNKELDAGDIIKINKIEITNNDNSFSIFNKLNNLLFSNLNNIIFDIKNNNISLKKQNENNANFYKFYTLKDSFLDFQKETTNILLKKIKAGNLYKPAHFSYNNINVIIWEAQEYKKNFNAIAGDALGISENDGLLIQTGNSTIELLKLQFNIYNSYKISGKEFITMI